MEKKLEFSLAQGWTKGLSICFETSLVSSQLDLNSFANTKQVHGDKILSWKHDVSLQSQQADGLWAEGEIFKQNKGKILIKSADCAPLFYIDRENKLICGIHAGWRGLAKNIHLKPFTHLGFNPLTTWVWLGPCLNGESFEVGPDMYSQFNQKAQNDSAIFKKGNGDKKFFYTWNFLKSEFESKKVELFYNVEENTFTNLEFSSHRRALKEGKERVDQLNYSWIAAI